MQLLDMICFPSLLNELYFIAKKLPYQETVLCKSLDACMRRNQSSLIVWLGFSEKNKAVISEWTLESILNVSWNSRDLFVGKDLQDHQVPPFCAR